MGRRATRGRWLAAGAVAVGLVTGSLGVIGVAQAFPGEGDETVLPRPNEPTFYGLGRAVAAAGNTVVVSSFVEHEAVEDGSWSEGWVHVYTPDGLGGYAETELTASDATVWDFFGRSVAVSDGTVVVGASGDGDGGLGSGSAYVYTPDGVGGYDEVKLTASDASADADFGRSVAMSGDTVVVGAPGARSAYLYTRDGAGGFDEVKLTGSDGLAYFGRSVAASGDKIAVGRAATFAGTTGAVYVFTPNGVGGYEEDVLTPAAAVSNDRFGYSVALSGDTVVGGAPDSSSVYVFTPDGAGGYDETKLTETSTGVSSLGHSVAMSGDSVVAGAPSYHRPPEGGGIQSGAAFVYTPDGAGAYDSARLLTAVDLDLWPSAGYQPEVGYSVAVSGDRVVVGAPCPTCVPNTGSAHVFGPPVARLPDAPTILRNATAQSAQATVSWTAPASDGGSPISGYVVTPYVGYFPLAPRAFSSTATTQTITGLTNGTQYRFRVQAVTDVGTGPSSAVTNPVIPAVSVPGAPTIGTAVAGSQQATVSWTAPASDGGSPISGFVVTPYVGYFPLAPRAFSSTATTQTITGLSNGTTYRFRVQAINAVGTSAYSKVTNPVTPSA